MTARFVAGDVIGGELEIVRLHLRHVELHRREARRARR
jgi:hypothetical protein